MIKTFGYPRTPETSLTWDERYPESYVYKKSQAVENLKRKLEELKMKKCLRCDDTFEEPKEVRIWNPRLSKYFEGNVILSCPKCGCYHFEEVDEDG